MASPHQRLCPSHFPEVLQEAHTIDFDPQFVTVYAAGDASEPSEATQVARYAHGITDLVANGDVYLKMQGRSARVAALSLTSSALAETRLPGRPDVQPDQDRGDLFMPGVTD